MTKNVDKKNKAHIGIRAEKEKEKEDGWRAGCLSAS